MPKPLCDRCTARPCIGGQKSGVPKALAALCQVCAGEDLMDGKCPICSNGLKTKTHAKSCLEQTVAA